MLLNNEKKKPIWIIIRNLNNGHRKQLEQLETKLIDIYGIK